jgi:hypothetical protein
MKIRLGLSLDGQRGWHSENRLGHTTVGPIGFLNILETQLGLHSKEVSQSERIVYYRDCLKRCDAPERFYHRTFETDELGTAATLLGWRDQWILHGWSGFFEGAVSPRLQDIADVECVARDRVPPGVGDRLGLVLASMEHRQIAVDEIELIDPLEWFPKRWRVILDMLPVNQNQLPLGDGGLLGEGFLGEMQEALRKVENGHMTSKLAWKGDGTLKVVQAETRLLAGRWLAQAVIDSGQEGLIVSGADGAILDSIFVAANGSRQGFREASAFRPSLQVLPLALEILWEPLNFYGLLQFLTHPICPLPGYARKRLAGKLAGKPGIGGESWEDALSDIDAHYQGRTDEIRNTIHFWVEHPRYVQDQGAPLKVVLDRVSRLTDYFRARLSDTDRTARIAFNAGFAQCSVCRDALDALVKQGVETIKPRQLQKLVTQATARGSENPLLEPEVGALMGVSDPAAVCDAFDHVFWWQLGLPQLPSSYPWSSAEMKELAMAGIELSAINDVLNRIAKTWLKPIFAARKSLVLVLPPKGDEVHPVWLMIEAIVDCIPIAHLESVLVQETQQTIPVVHTPLPSRKRWWTMPAGSVEKPLHQVSYSSLELFLFNPYQWLLKYPAALRPSRILSVSSNFQLFGNLAHAMVEHFFRQKNAMSITENELMLWFDANFDKLVAEDGAVLLMPGRRSDLEGFRIKLRESLRQLRKQLIDAEIVEVLPEYELSGHYVGGKIHGYADLILKNRLGMRSVVDMKWSGSGKYSDKLKNNRHLQLAIYAEMLRQSEELWPSVAYYILDAGQLYVTDTNFFPSAQKIFADTGEGTAHLWQRFVATWEWRQKQIEAGIFELVFDDVLADEDSQPPEDGLPIEILSPEYNDYQALAGWDE